MLIQKKLLLDFLMFGLGLDKYSPMLGGQFDKEPLNLDDSEHRRKLAAVEVISIQQLNEKF